MIDWLKEKLHGRTHLCWECANYISNNQMDQLFLNNHTYCEGGGFCCPYYGVPYFIGVNKHDTFCSKFKFRNMEIPKALLKLRKDNQNEQVYDED